MMMHPANTVADRIEIRATGRKVWEVITGKPYMKALGGVFDKGAFISSDWKQGSKVDFVYEPDRIAASGKISELLPEKYIRVDYDFHGFLYTEKFTIQSVEGVTSLSVDAGPYGADYEAQKVVWHNWLLKAKELSEMT